MSNPNYRSENRLPEKFRIDWFDKEIIYDWHFFQTLLPRRTIEKYHHLISPFMYSERTIGRLDAQLFRMKWEETNQNPKGIR